MSEGGSSQGGDRLTQPRAHDDNLGQAASQCSVPGGRRGWGGQGGHRGAAHRVAGHRCERMCGGGENERSDFREQEASMGRRRVMRGSVRRFRRGEGRH